jgi:uncharacterized membrane protein HdeD (DUF308 family)
MKIFQSSIFRAICAIVVGVLILKFPQDGITWLTIAVGVLFLLSGVIAMIAYWNAKKHAGEYTIIDKQGRVISGSQPTFPIVGAGSIILGLVLALTPSIFINGLMYILGAIMILGAINQLVSLISARRFGSIHFAFWIAPCVILLIGLFVILKPMESAELPLIILAWCSLLYGVAEIVNTLKIYSIRRAAKRQEDGKIQVCDDQDSIAEEISSEVNHTPASTNSNSSQEEDYPDFIG